jgi:hypothetical protein
MENKLFFIVLFSCSLLFSLSFLAAGTCDGYAFGDTTIYEGANSYCDFNTGNFITQKNNGSICMNDFECISGFCINDLCNDGASLLRDFSWLFADFCPQNSVNITSAGCINMSSYFMLTDGLNTSATCAPGLSCYVCNSGFFWNSTLSNCQISVAVPPVNPNNTNATNTTNPNGTIPGGNPGSSGGGGGGSSNPSCITTWTCAEWSACINSVQIRTCSKFKGYCYADPATKPSESQTCTQTVSTTDYVVPVSTPAKDPLRVLKIALVILIIVLLLAALIWFIIWKMKQSKLVNPNAPVAYSA